MLLVAGAGLFARSLYNLKTLDTGYQTEHLITFHVDPALNGYDQPRIKRFYDQLLQDVRQTPGVQSASVAQVAVLTGNASSRTVQVQGYESKSGENMNPWTNEIAPDYFRTVGMPLVVGREFTERDVDGAPLVAIVNESFAKYFFPNQNPIGHRFGFRSMNNPAAMEIVGRRARLALRRDAPGHGRTERNAALRLHAVPAERRAERDDDLRPDHAPASPIGCPSNFGRP